MKRGKNIFWGVLFLAGAAALLVGKMGLLGGIGFWSVLFSVGLAGVFVEGLIRRSWGRMLFALAFLAIVNGDVLGIEKLVPWTVLGVAALGTIGLNMLFPLKRRYGHQGNMVWTKGVGEDCYDVVIGEDGGERVNCEISFGSSAKYISSSSLKEVRLESSFGTLEVHLDHVVLKEQQARVLMEVSFGSIELYVPAEWHVVFDVSSAFGGVKEYGHDNPNGENVLFVNGEVSFGELDIHYV